MSKIEGNGSFFSQIGGIEGPLNGCQISQAPHYGYEFAIYQHRDVMTVDISSYFDLSQTR